MATAARPYQIVVWGASGFTGRLVCEHIARDYQEVPILVADAFNSTQVGDVLKQSTVVLSTAGPFARYGNTIVEQSVAQGTHYCDITGEAQFVKRNIAKYHKEAQRKGVKIVHCCGYDSVPSDLGTFMVVDYIKKQLGKKTAKVYTLVESISGAASGGTLFTAMGIFETEPKAELAKSASDVYYLAEEDSRGSDTPTPFTPAKVEPIDHWGAPFVMEAVNGRIVHRSNSLYPGHYGTDFKYREHVDGGSGWSGFFKASLISFTTILLGISFALAPLRWALKRVLPSPGQGPTPEQQRAGYWRHITVGVTEEAPGVKPTIVKARSADRRDPGYWSTSRMLLEAGLCLALQSKALEEAGYQEGGVLTPATAMGMLLIERLRAAGQTWEVSQEA